jgi:hypothetical protein
MDLVADQMLDPSVDACHEVDRRHLVRCSCGNLSVPIDAMRQQDMVLMINHGRVIPARDFDHPRGL